MRLMWDQLVNEAKYIDWTNRHSGQFAETNTISAIADRNQRVYYGYDFSTASTHQFTVDFGEDQDKVIDTIVLSNFDFTDVTAFYYSVMATPASSAATSTGAITEATNTYTINTVASHTLVTGDHVRLTKSGGTQFTKEIFYCTRVDDDTFTVIDDTGLAPTGTYNVYKMTLVSGLTQITPVPSVGDYSAFSPYVNYITPATGDCILLQTVCADNVPVTIGRLMVGEYHEFDLPASTRAPLNLSVIDKSSKRRLHDGGIVPYDRTVHRALAMQFLDLSDADATQVRHMCRDTGLRGDILVDVYPNATGDRAEEHRFVGFLGEYEGPARWREYLSSGAATPHSRFQCTIEEGT